MNFRAWFNTFTLIQRSKPHAYLLRHVSIRGSSAELLDSYFQSWTTGLLNILFNYPWQLFDWNNGREAGGSGRFIEYFCRWFTPESITAMCACGPGSQLYLALHQKNKASRSREGILPLLSWDPTWVSISGPPEIGRTWTFWNKCTEGPRRWSESWGLS